MEASTVALGGPVAEYHDRDAWLLERHRQGVGSSEVPIILGVDPFGRSEADLQRKKLAAIDEGRLLDSEENDAMLRGRLFEDPAIELWKLRAERGRNVRRVALRRSRELPTLLSSADRQALSSDDYPTAPLEVKVPGWRQFRVIEDGGLSDYMNVQGQVHSHVHGAEGTEWAVMRADPLGLRGFWIPADGAFHEIMLERVDRWWERHIVNREPAPEIPSGEPLVDLSKLPKVEGRVVTLTELDDIAFLKRMAEAREVRDEADEFYKVLVDEVKAGRFPLGVFEGAGVRMYHAERAGRKSIKVTAADLAQLVDPLRLQAALTRELDRFGVTPVVLQKLLAHIADEVRPDVEAYEQTSASYQEVKLYQLRSAEF